MSEIEQWLADFNRKVLDPGRDDLNNVHPCMHASMMQGIQEEMRDFIKFQFLVRGYLNILDSEMDILVREATAEYISNWLELDVNAQLTIESFVKYGYYSKEERKNRKTQNGGSNKYDITDIESKVEKLKYAERKLCWNFEEYNMLARRRGEPYKKCESKLNYLRLCFISQYEELCGMWPLFEMMFYKKTFLRETRSKKRPDGSLKTAYLSYAKYLREVKEIQSDREFVINCLSFRKLELSYRWGFIANLAKCMQERDLRKNEIDLAIYCYYGEGSNYGDPLPRSNSKLLVGYDNYISYVCSQNDALSREMVLLSEQVLLIRCIIDDAVALYKLVYPIRSKPSWDENHFKSAREFLSSYGINKVLSSLDFLFEKEDNDKLFKFIGNLMHRPDVSDPQLVKRSRRMKMKQEKTLRKKKQISNT